jgi:hypothetical protein
MTVTPVGVRPSPTRVAHAGLDCFYKRILYPPFFTAADETLLRAVITRSLACNEL